MKKVSLLLVLGLTLGFANGFGQEAVEMSGPVNQGAPAAPVAGAPDVQNPSTPTTGGNTRTAYQETSTDNPSTPGEVVAPPAAGDTLPPNQTVAPPPAATNPVSPPM